MDDFQCIELDNINDVAVVKFKDEKLMDPERIEALGKELMHVVQEEENSDKVVINFENVSFFSSAAINKLIVLDKRVKAKGGELRLSNLRPEVRDLFSYTNLDTLFRIKEDQNDAVESFDD